MSLEDKLNKLPPGAFKDAFVEQSRGFNPTFVSDEVDRYLEASPELKEDIEAFFLGGSLADVREIKRQTALEEETGTPSRATLKRQVEGES